MVEADGLLRRDPALSPQRRAARSGQLMTVRVLGGNAYRALQSVWVA
jgi:hypothetical protein